MVDGIMRPPAAFTKRMASQRLYADEDGQLKDITSKIKEQDNRRQSRRLSNVKDEKVIRQMIATETTKHEDTEEKENNPDLTPQKSFKAPTMNVTRKRPVSTSKLADMLPEEFAPWIQPGDLDITLGEFFDAVNVRMRASIENLALPNSKDPKGPEEKENKANSK